MSKIKVQFHTCFMLMEYIDTINIAPFPEKKKKTTGRLLVESSIRRTALCELWQSGRRRAV